MLITLNFSHSPFFRLKKRPKLRRLIKFPFFGGCRSVHARARSLRREILLNSPQNRFFINYRILFFPRSHSSKREEELFKWILQNGRCSPAVQDLKIISFLSVLLLCHKTSQRRFLQFTYTHVSVFLTSSVHLLIKNTRNFLSI